MSLWFITNTSQCLLLWCCRCKSLLPHFSSNEQLICITSKINAVQSLLDLNPKSPSATGLTENEENKWGKYCDALQLQTSYKQQIFIWISLIRKSIWFTSEVSLNRVQLTLSVFVFSVLITLVNSRLVYSITLRPPRLALYPLSEQ